MFISSNSFLVESLGFFICHMTSSANRDNVFVPFQFGCIFISFSCLIALARASGTMLNKTGKDGHLCLSPGLRGKAFSFLPSGSTSYGLVMDDSY